MIAHIITEIDNNGSPDYERTGDQIPVISYKSISKNIVDPENVGRMITLDLRIVVFKEIEKGALIELNNKIYRNMGGESNISGSYRYDFTKIRS